jgi:hypothetical protein
LNHAIPHEFFGDGIICGNLTEGYGVWKKICTKTTHIHKKNRNKIFDSAFQASLKNNITFMHKGFLTRWLKAVLKEKLHCD